MACGEYGSLQQARPAALPQASSVNTFGCSCRILLCSTVVELGEGVTDLAVGDRVAMEPGIPCWTNKSSRCAASCCERQGVCGAWRSLMYQRSHGISAGRQIRLQGRLPAPGAEQELPSA